MANIPTVEDTLIQCISCCRTFDSQAQFGQHSRICSKGARSWRKIPKYPYICTFVVTGKEKLQIKTRYLVSCEPEAWDPLRKKELSDKVIKALLSEKNCGNVRLSFRKKKDPPAIIINFICNDIEKDTNAIHQSKTLICNAVSVVQALFHSHNVPIKLHACKWENCNDVVIRDTEGYCSRHRQQIYHKPKRKKTQEVKTEARVKNEPVTFKTSLLKHELPPPAPKLPTHPPPIPYANHTTTITAVTFGSTTTTSAPTFHTLPSFDLDNTVSTDSSLSNHSSSMTREQLFTPPTFLHHLPQPVLTQPMVQPVKLEPPPQVTVSSSSNKRTYSAMAVTDIPSTQSHSTGTISIPTKIPRLNDGSSPANRSVTSVMEPSPPVHPNVSVEIDDEMRECASLLVLFAKQVAAERYGYG